MKECHDEEDEQGNYGACQRRRVAVHLPVELCGAGWIRHCDYWVDSRCVLKGSKGGSLK